jgi:hypothetical protein
MKISQNKFVLSLPKVILFVIAFYNFVWTYLETLDPMAGRGIAAAWYSTKDFPLAQFLLVIAIYLLFIKNRWSYLLSVIISGYFSISWISLIIKWVWTTNYSSSERFNIITSGYNENPLTIWESQVALATVIFTLSIFHLIKQINTKQPITLS